MKFKTADEVLEYIKKDIIIDIKKLIVARDKPNNLNSISLQFGILLLKLSKSFVLSKLSIEFEAQLDDSFNKPNSIPEWYPEIIVLEIKKIIIVYSQ